MKTIISPKSTVFIFGVPITLLLVLVLLMKYVLSIKQEVMGYAVTIDLLLTVPVIYFLLIRKKDIPKTTVIPVMIIGFLLGSFFLPKDHQSLLLFFKTWCLPLIEVVILIFVATKLIKAIKAYRILKTDEVADFYSLMCRFASEILPRRVAKPFATEIAVFYYGFLSWRKLQLNNNMFSYHKKSGTDILLAVFIFMIAIETLAVHLLLERWNVYVAWALSGLSIYTMIQAWGFLRSLAKRPILLDKNKLVLKYGIMNETSIPYTDIDEISLSGESLKEEDGAVMLSLLGELEKHNVIIKLKKEHTLIGLYGSKKQFIKIGLYIDEPTDFEEKLIKQIVQK